MAEHAHDSGCIGVELRGVYDGVAFWHCFDGVRRHRFTPGHYVRERQSCSPGVWRSSMADLHPYGDCAGPGCLDCAEIEAIVLAPPGPWQQLADELDQAAVTVEHIQREAIE